MPDARFGQEKGADSASVEGRMLLLLRVSVFLQMFGEQIIHFEPGQMRQRFDHRNQHQSHHRHAWQHHDDIAPPRHLADLGGVGYVVDEGVGFYDESCQAVVQG